MGTRSEAERRHYLESLFPNLARSGYAIRENPDKTYNCIAWVLGSTREWWWPEPYSMWPIRQRHTTVACFAKLFEAQGFERVPDASMDKASIKIALYVLQGVPTHAARIESAAIWSSKIGREELIEHAPDGLNGEEYGFPKHFFRKKD